MVDRPMPAERDLLVTTAQLVGVVFLLVGILGFIPGITTDYDQLAFAGHDSGALLLGLFMVSVLHNLVHVAFGVAGLVLSRTRGGRHQPVQAVVEGLATAFDEPVGVEQQG
jgi:hypothetical protein